MVKALLLATLSLGLAANAAAERLLIDSLSIELPSGSTHRVERSAPPDSAFGDRISIHRQNGAGTLYLQTYRAAEAVDAEALRTLTNVPSTEPLMHQDWGDFSGYRHDYTENGMFHRTWWLAQDESVLFITYQCVEGQENLELDWVEHILQSLSSATLPGVD